MATKKFEPTVQLDNGLIIPASAAANYVLTSDSSGNATWVSPNSNILAAAKSYTLSTLLGGISS